MLDGNKLSHIAIGWRPYFHPIWALTLKGTEAVFPRASAPRERKWEAEVHFLPTL
jgi:hypothetical protein